MTRSRILLVTGTGTDVGKTVATAALAACALAEGQTVAVVKLAQTGLAPGEPGDLAEITRLTGITDVFEFARYPDPLSPHHAARVSGLPELDKGEAIMRVLDLANRFDLVLVEGAGGVLVPFDSFWFWTIADLAGELDAPGVVVTQAGLGTLNHTALTMLGLENGGMTLAGLIIGSWPAEPDLAMRCVLPDLRRMCPKRAIGGVLPAGLPAMRDFAAQAREGLGPEFGGTFDSPAFLARHQS